MQAASVVEVVHENQIRKSNSAPWKPTSGQKNAWPEWSDSLGNPCSLPSKVLPDEKWWRWSSQGWQIESGAGKTGWLYYRNFKKMKDKLPSHEIPRVRDCARTRRYTRTRHLVRAIIPGESDVLASSGDQLKASSSVEDVDVVMLQPRQHSVSVRVGASPWSVPIQLDLTPPVLDNSTDDKTCLLYTSPSPRDS